MAPSTASIGTSLPAATSTVPPANKLHALLGHYNSDDEQSENDDQGADAEFKDFMNEVKAEAAPPGPPAVPSVWQELWDPQSGQPYYWHTITNELTWDKPQDLLKPAAQPPSAASKSTAPETAKTTDAKRVPMATNKAPTTAKPVDFTNKYNSIHIKHIYSFILIIVSSCAGLHQVHQETQKLFFQPPERMPKLASS